MDFTASNGWRLLAAPFIFLLAWSIVTLSGKSTGLAGVVVWFVWATFEIVFPSWVNESRPEHQPLARISFAVIVALAWTGIGYGIIKFILLVADHAGLPR